MRKQTKLWKMKSGDKVRICDMTDAHLFHSMQMLKNIAELHRVNNLDFYLNCKPPTADIAGELFDQEVNNAFDATWDDFVLPIYRNMEEEVERRKRCEER